MIITEKTKCPVAEGMFGLFFEDINYALDGGLHAEMIENRGFEFFDCGGERYHWYKHYDGLYGWQGSENASLTIAGEEPLYRVNPHYLRFHAERSGAYFTNKAYDGIFLEKGKEYRLSFYARSEEKQQRITVGIRKDDRAVCLQPFAITSEGWQKYETVWKAAEDVHNGEFRISAEEPGTICFDFVSLKPADALLGVFRKDLAEALKELRPGFLRFPGGCVVEGNTIDSMYRWKLSVGIPEKRKANWNRWAVQVNDHGKYSHYNQSLGVGYFEYFLLCEYLGASPLPVCNVGMACQFQSIERYEIGDSLFDACVQDALDLIEFANGPADSKWGALRAEMGHPEPFGLQMLGIGNEQWETPESRFFERYQIFEERIHEKYPAIRLIGSAGPRVRDEYYEKAWNHYRARAKKDYVYAVDEHYYVPPQWMTGNTHFYDAYPREIPVFAGEYAAHEENNVKTPARNTLRSAVAEAAFLTGIERNSDVVVMASYAPLLAREGYAQWSPDLIWFNDTAVCRTPNYYVQQFFSLYTGEEELEVDDYEEEEKRGIFVSASRKGKQFFLKLVNTTECEQELCLSGDLAGEQDVTVITLSGNAEDHNDLSCPDRVVPVKEKRKFREFTKLPGMSVTILICEK